MISANRIYNYVVYHENVNEEYQDLNTGLRLCVAFLEWNTLEKLGVCLMNNTQALNSGSLHIYIYIYMYRAMIVSFYSGGPYG